MSLLRFILIAKEGDAMSYRIGSFNLYKLNFRSDNEVRKNYEKILKIIEQEKIDIIAMQEVFNEGSLKLIFGENSKYNKWAYAWAKPEKSKSSTAAEGYAYAWRKDRFQLSYTTDLSGNKKIYEPRIINQYQKHTYDDLLRNPFYARFTPAPMSGGGYFEFRIINTHIRFNKNEDDESDFGEIPMRKNEFEILAKSIYPKIADRVYGRADGEYYTPNKSNEKVSGCSGNRVVYTILLGDYNLNLKREWNTGPYVPSSHLIGVYETGNVFKTAGTIHGMSTDFIIANDGKIIQTVQESRSTLRRNNNTNETAESKYANNYDHFSYDVGRFSDHLNVSVQRVDAVKKYYGNDFDAYKKEVSDHLPIILNVDIKR